MVHTLANSADQVQFEGMARKSHIQQQGNIKISRKITALLHSSVLFLVPLWVND